MKKQTKKRKNKISSKEEELSEKVSELIGQIGKITLEVQSLRDINKGLRERVAFCEGTIRAKDTKINMIKSVLGK